MAPLSRPMRCLLGAALLSVAEAVSLHDAALRGPGAEDGHMRLGGGHRSNTSAKTMVVQGHTVSAVSERWTGKVVYAIFTSAIDRYHDRLVTQLETWASRPAAEGRYVAVGGNNYPEEWQSQSVMKSECGDSMFSISCKEATLLAEGAARGADWLVVVGEDNYVHTRNVEEALEEHDPTQNVAFGGVGCGRGLFCHDNADFESAGGFCGGGGYIISRGALQTLLANGATALHEVYDASTDPNDMTTSCQLRKHGTSLEEIMGLHGSPMFEIQEYESTANSKFLTVHYLNFIPVMRWFHAEVEGAEDSEKQRLKLLAFNHGCARGMDNHWWHGFHTACMSKNRELPWPVPADPDDPQAALA